MTIPSVPTYRERVERLIDAGDVDELLRWAYGRRCACFTRGDEPKCVCKMCADELRRHIVPAWLKYGRIVRVPGKADGD